ncbi:hypothetical protein K1T71_013960 [Dendrolimus kikuchii]|uniref:Uncharacterized protein n=1 Tax=Dendrolimus kikuchii TaxID=765133 RepID=A0ACC1CGK4_9NEOP|nr:hypothetical protein K1T71_013960 [Dendrolimus kikuchii]
MLSDEVSCSDCKLELIEKIWTKVLLNWINKCVIQNKTKVQDLNVRNLVEIINRYKYDICYDDIDRAMLCTDDLEPFIKYKYPILRLRYFCEAKDYPKKLYLMTTILLYHCCCSSQTGVVDTDICTYLEKPEQEVILKFCEQLSDMEATVNNVESAIRGGLIVNNGLYCTIVILFQVLPSAIIADSSNYSDIIECEFDSKTDTALTDKGIYEMQDLNVFNVEKNIAGDTAPKDSNDSKSYCQPNCECTNCITAIKACGDPGNSMDQCIQPRRLRKFLNPKWKIYAAVFCVIFLFVLILVMVLVLKRKPIKANDNTRKLSTDVTRFFQPNTWECVNNLCQKVYKPTAGRVYASHTRCTLLCMGPQLWPYPIGYTYYSKTIVSLATNKLEYRIQSVPSEIVHQYLAEAFKLFIGDLARLERMETRVKNDSQEASIKKMYIKIEVESDPDPRLRLNTEEAYTLKIDTASQVNIHLVSMSFCGIRHALETLSQLIMLDQSTGYLITLTNVVIKDAPSYKYRGLMIDTARNYIPMQDLMRTVDAMASCKLNTFHWRISDVASFPLLIPNLSNLFEYGGYDRSKVYTRDDVKSLVKRAGIRGIRVLIEVAAPGPVGRPWSWAADATCPAKTENFTCDNILCLRLTIQDSILDVLQTIYAEIIDMTNIDDVFHLSDGIFSMSNCYYLIEDRLGFLDKALERLKLANKGFMPKLPIIWYTSHLTRGMEAMTWDRLGVQLTEWTVSTDQFLNKFKVIHSSKWDLSCELKKNRCKRYRTWQEMYSWKSWRNIEVFMIEGGEAVLWTDIVDSNNIDYHLWPRAAAVAERLWSDIVVNATASGPVYVRLDSHRWRLTLRAVKVQPIWPVWCSFNPGQCLLKIR